MSETAVVTGATGGIGQAVVGTLAANGYRVYALGRAQDKLAAVQSADVVACTADLSRRGLAPRGGAPARSARHDDLSGRRPNGALAQGP